jgi:hypothetical protein
LGAEEERVGVGNGGRHGMGERGREGVAQLS